MTSPQNDAVTSRQNRWHQSTLSTLLDGCSWQYFLTYILEIEQGVRPFAAVGTAYHSAVELREIGRMEGRDVTLKEMIAHAEAELLAVTDDTELLTKVRAALRNWDDYVRPYLDLHTPIAIEPEFTVPLVDGAKPVGGYLDGVYRDGETGEIFILDHKTAKDLSRWKDAEGHRHQAAMYAAAMVLSPDFPEITELPEMRYLVVRTSRSTRANFEPFREVRVRPDMEDVRVLGERIRLAEAIVAGEKFRRTPEWILCSSTWCPFHERCMVTEELAGTPATVRMRLGSK
jgi:RecB family exonuclease